MISRALSSAGLLAALLGSACIHVPVSAAALPAAERALLLTALEALFTELSPTPVVCLQQFGGTEGARDVDAELLALLRRNRPVVQSAECPRTYAQMFVPRDSAARAAATPPPGHVDPYQIVVSRPQYELPDYAWLYIRVYRGATGEDYICTAQAQEPPPRASCRRSRQWMH